MFYNIDFYGIQLILAQSNSNVSFSKEMVHIFHGIISFVCLFYQYVHNYYLTIIKAKEIYVS